MLPTDTGTQKKIMVVKRLNEDMYLRLRARFIYVNLINLDNILLYDIIEVVLVLVSVTIIKKSHLFSSM